MKCLQKSGIGKQGTSLGQNNSYQSYLSDQAVCDTASSAASESAGTLQSSTERTSIDYQPATFQMSLVSAEMSAQSQQLFDYYLHQLL